ncbi:uncharacterized protein N7473_011755 [Penicillium subrubescens]|uniref:uncharacterized protein n=1 Tax=Penicillium subrubescens TaxID=1316194 RepID=UPI002544DD96|nr:uncharacterized protein N7473_011755 [Penicillium subrubescens]KAJ5880702.1 hypothetical protein N7473_011755 [Penicillium subrubescens]
MPPILVVNLMNSRFHTLRELVMIRWINSIAEKKNWHENISNATWVHQSKQSFKSNEKDVTESMIKWRAFLFKQSGLTLVFDAIIKSDAVISSELHQKLRSLIQTRHPLAYGVTRVVQNEVINMDDCLKSIGRGAPLSLHEADPLAAPE